MHIKPIMLRFQCNLNIQSYQVHEIVTDVLEKFLLVKSLICSTVAVVLLLYQIFVKISCFPQKLHPFEKTMSLVHELQWFPLVKVNRC